MKASMNIFCIDFETYYDKDFSLSKLTTEEYIRSKDFEVIGVAVQRKGEEPVWFSGTQEKTKEWLEQFNFADHAVIAHNAVFDMAILNWHFDIRPKIIVDTLSMARALHGTEVGGSLKVLAEHYNLGVKGTEVLDAKGKQRIDFNAEDLASYGEYCRNDVRLTMDLFKQLSGDFPLFEYKLIDLTIRMFTEPVLELDRASLVRLLEEIHITKNALLLRATSNRESLLSNAKFAQELESLGVTCPIKISPTTGKETWALSKNDEEFKALLEHENPIVQALASARIGIKSTLEETRTMRFMDIEARGALPIPLRYYAAHTGRWGGDDKINMQNLGRKSNLKYAIRAPDGYFLIDADSSQIEARTLAWLASQNDLVDAFERGEDVYKIMASAIYNKPVEEITPDERFVGKTTILGCISEGTPVLCKSGWKPIEQVSLYDELWDGEEWVCHQGLVKKGLKETLSLSGLWLTPDHKVLCGTQWLEAQSVVADENILCRALDTGAENLPLLGISKEHEEVYPQSLLNVPAEDLSIPLTNITLKTLNLQGAIYVLKNQAIQLANYIGGIATYLNTTSIGKDCLIAYQAVSNAVIQSLVKHTHIMAVEGLQYTNLGARIKKSSYATLYHSMGGMTQNETLTGLTTTKDTHQTTYDLQLGLKTPVIKEKLISCSRNLMTYDIAYAGPRNRFTVRTDKGPIIVHNCGYGMGNKKFRIQLKTFNVDLSEEECERIIKVYRETYDWVPALWKRASTTLDAMIENKTISIGRDKILVVDGKKGIRLPNGMYIKYPNLRKVDKDNGGYEYVYDVKKGKSTYPSRIYGGKVIENVCQALARIIIGEQMLMINKKYKVVMTVHDAVACIVPEHELATAREYVVMCMRMRPKWAMELPLNCESGVGTTYGHCSAKEAI